MSPVQNTERQQQLAAAQEMNVEMLPGTEILTDVGNLRRIHDHNTQDSMVLVPQPSADPNDPLVWEARTSHSAWELIKISELESKVEDLDHGQSMLFRSVEHHAQSVHCAVVANFRKAMEQKRDSSLTSRMS
jgi:hypothetical protein